MTSTSRRTISLKGVFPPIPTPFDGEGRVHLAALADNLERWNGCGLAGYVVLGSNREPVYVNEQEKIEVWQAARAAIPDHKLMIAGTGCESTQETIHLTRLAADAGGIGGDKDSSTESTAGERWNVGASHFLLRRCPPGTERGIQHDRRYPSRQLLRTWGQRADPLVCLVCLRLLSVRVTA